MSVAKMLKMTMRRDSEYSSGVKELNKFPSLSLSSSNAVAQWNLSRTESSEYVIARSVRALT